MKTHLVIASTLIATSLAGCGGGDDGGDGNGNGIDTALLAEYRAAIPSMDQLAASAPTASVSAALGDPAMLPSGSYDIVVGINGAVSGIVEVMRAVVMLEPTVYNSDTKEFFWGPFPNDNGFGYVAAYVRDAGESADFRYHYALLRGVDEDVAKLQPVIWGGATPVEGSADHGAGITLWDFEANAAWEEANNPAPGALARGRFVAVYGKQNDEAGNTVTLVYSVFRNFIPEENPTAEPADLDYLYGRVAGANNTIDFIDWKASFDVSEPADGTLEDVAVRMAFLDEGIGRAEAAATGGSLGTGEEFQVVECWDGSISQSYISYGLAGSAPTEEGVSTDCGLFDLSLTQLGVPSLADVPAELKTALDGVAQNGVPGN